MDDRRLSTYARSSTLPLPTSRLPLLPKPSGIPAPATSAGLRTSASKEGLRGLSQTTTTNNIRTTTTSRLRTSTSRDQLKASTGALRKPRSIAPPVSSQAFIRDARNRSASREPTPKDKDDSIFKRPPIPRKQPSGHFTQAHTQSESAMEEEEGPRDMLQSLNNSMEEGATFDTTRSQPRKPRPSLSERTIETLAQLPSSPAFKRRGSDFLGSDGVRRPASRAGSGSRPGSSYQSDCSTGRSLSRPGSSSGPSDISHANFRSSSNPYKFQFGTVQETPAKRTSAIAKMSSIRTTGELKPPSSASSRMQTRPSLPATLESRTPSPEKQPQTSLKYGSKTVAARPLKPRASINGLFKKPSLPSLDNATATSELPIHPPRKVSPASPRSSATSGEDRNLSSASTVSTALTVDSVEEAPASTAKKSSAALREQIAKAKAASRAAVKQDAGTSVSPPIKSPLIPTDTTFDFGLSDDPFGQKQFESSNRKVMQSRIAIARTTGRLNIAAMGLKQIPEDVLKMYDLEFIGGYDGAWAESVDLTRFVAADNELEALDDSVFPDMNPSDLADGEESGGHQFGGLESLDLHGNILIAVPLGLRRLQFLTSLNLAQNQLANNCLEIISQVVSLRDLKLGNNLLYGTMDSCFSKLTNLEILDLRGNNITALSDGFERLSRLRILNVNENALESLPFKSLCQLPLTELLAHKNKLTGTLIEAEVKSLSQLQTLDISANQLTLLTSADAAAPVSMPSLHQMTLSLNRIKALPDMRAWKSLISLTADDNSIAAIPDGFTALDNLRHVDFTRNDIRVIPAEIARMDGLAMLRITGNPLREKKLVALTTEELKATLASRLEPAPGHDDVGTEQLENGFFNGERQGGSTETTVTDYDENDSSRSDYEDFATPPTSAPGSPAKMRLRTIDSQMWPIEPGGILDRSNTQSSSLHPVICSRIAADQAIREIRLQHNIFTSFPNSLSFFVDTLTSLSLSHNQLVGESFLTEELDLTALKELNLSNNHVSSLAPLVSHLRAPNLQKIDVSCNRIAKLPVLRDALPSVTVLLMANNHLEDLDPETIKGMNIVDASNNDIAHLNPRIGLLGGTGNLERLEVNGNRFRVPRWNILERGTETTLRWLRGRVPVAEMAEWRRQVGDVNDDGDFE